VVTASARNLPALMYTIEDRSVANITCIRPPIFPRPARLSGVHPAGERERTRAAS
jgi:hypothetical protein